MRTGSKLMGAWYGVQEVWYEWWVGYWWAVTPTGIIIGFVVRRANEVDKGEIKGTMFV